MLIQKQPKSDSKISPIGVEEIKKIALTPKEKRAIFLALEKEIYKYKRLIENKPL